MSMYGGKKVTGKASSSSGSKTTKMDERKTKPANRTGKTSQGNIGKK